MTKADLVEQVANAIGPGITKKDCSLVVDGLLNAIKEALANHQNIEIRGFGTFKVRKRKSRVARNPRTGERVEVPARAVPIFKPSTELRGQVSRRRKFKVCPSAPARAGSGLERGRAAPPGTLPTRGAARLVGGTCWLPRHTRASLPLNDDACPAAPVRPIPRFRGDLRARGRPARRRHRRDAGGR